MKELRQYARIVGNAENEDQPGFPPLSPLTTSYFTTWAFFDVLFGQSHETIGTCLLRLARDMPFPGWLVDAIGTIQKSRLGFYEHDGFEDRFVRLREIECDRVKLCHIPSGYKRAEGQIWFGRLVQPMNDVVNYHVFFTTPYIMIETAEATITAYLKREITRLGGRRFPRTMDAHDFVLKHGPSPNHWNVYIFCAYRSSRRRRVHHGHSRRPGKSSPRQSKASGSSLIAPEFVGQ